MPSELKEDRENPSLNLNDLASRSATKDDIVLRIEEGIRIEEKRRQEIERLELERRRLLRARLALLFLLAVLSMGGVILYRSINRPPTPAPALAANDSPRTVGDATITPEEIDTANEYYVYEKASLEITGEGTHDLYIYDFHNNKFQWNVSTLTDPTALDDALKKFRSKPGWQEIFKKSWVLIFAGASCEGTDDRNLTLTQERVDVVGRLVNEKMGVPALGYWGLRVGEYLNVSDSKRQWCEDNAHEDAGPKEDWLEPQRRLTLIIITPGTPVPAGDAEDKKLVLLSDRFYRLNVLRDEYRYSRSDARALPARIPVSAPPKPKRTGTTRRQSNNTPST